MKPRTLMVTLELTSSLTVAEERKQWRRVPGVRQVTVSVQQPASLAEPRVAAETWRPSTRTRKRGGKR